MRDNWLSNRVFKSYDDIIDHCCYAWNISPSRGRENDYAKAAVAIKHVVGASNYFDLMRQCCIVRTDQTSVDLCDVIKNRLRIGVDILVIRLTRGSASSIRDPKDRETAARLIREIDTVFIR